MAYKNGLRYTSIPGSNNQYAIPNRKLETRAYAATVALAPLHNEVKILFAQLTGAMTITSDVTAPFSGDIMIMAFQSDGTGRVVTFSTGFTVNSTLTLIASKEANITFMFSDKSQTWVEVSRFIQT